MSLHAKKPKVLVGLWVFCCLEKREIVIAGVCSIAIHLLVFLWGSFTFVGGEHIFGGEALSLRFHSQQRNEYMLTDNSALNSTRRVKSKVRSTGSQLGVRHSANRSEKQAEARDDTANKSTTIKDGRLIKIWVAERVDPAALRELLDFSSEQGDARFEFDFMTKKIVLYSPQGAPVKVTGLLSRIEYSLRNIWQVFPEFKDKLLIEVELVIES